MPATRVYLVPLGPVSRGTDREFVPGRASDADGEASALARTALRAAPVLALGPGGLVPGQGVERPGRVHASRGVAAQALARALVGPEGRVLASEAWDVLATPGSGAETALIAELARLCSAGPGELHWVVCEARVARLGAYLALGLGALADRAGLEPAEVDGGDVEPSDSGGLELFEPPAGAPVALDLELDRGSGRLELRLAGLGLDWCPPRHAGGRERFPGGPGAGAEARARPGPAR